MFWLVLVLPGILSGIEQPKLTNKAWSWKFWPIVSLKWKPIYQKKKISCVTMLDRNCFDQRQKIRSFFFTFILSTFFLGPMRMVAGLFTNPLFDWVEKWSNTQNKPHFDISMFFYQCKINSKESVGIFFWLFQILSFTQNSSIFRNCFRLFWNLAIVELRMKTNVIFYWQHLNRLSNVFRFGRVFSSLVGIFILFSTFFYIRIISLFFCFCLATSASSCYH